MDISVIVPIYNVEKYIERCLRSLFTQTKTDGVEFIFINDCTPDRSMKIAHKIISEYAHLNIRVIEHKENRNVAATRQTGMDVATGDYIIQIDSDDWCEPIMLEKMYTKALKTGADIVFCNNYAGGEKITHYQCNDSVRLLKYTLCPPSNITVNVALWNKLVRRCLYSDNNIKVDTGLCIMEDFLTVIKLYFFAKKVEHIEEYYYHYTINNKSSITNNTHLLGFKHYDDFIKHVEQFTYNNKSQVLDNEILEWKRRIKLIWIRSNRGKRQKECIKYFQQVDNNILTTNRLPLTTKVPYFLIINGFTCIGNLIFNLSDLYKNKQYSNIHW